VGLAAAPARGALEIGAALQAGCRRRFCSAPPIAGATGVRLDHGFPGAAARHAGRSLSGRKALASPGPAGIEHLAPADRLHARTKAMPALANEFARLIGPLHVKSPSAVELGCGRQRPRPINQPRTSMPSPFGAYVRAGTKPCAAAAATRAPYRGATRAKSIERIGAVGIAVRAVQTPPPADGLPDTAAAETAGISKFDRVAERPRPICLAKAEDCIHGASADSGRLLLRRKPRP
jgi:hypothetical protein